MLKLVGKFYFLNLQNTHQESNHFSIFFQLIKSKRTQLSLSAPKTTRYLIKNLIE